MSAQDRRQQLVDVGLDLLGTRPIQDLTLDEVAVAAGVSRTLVFHYFPSKGDYFAEVVASAAERLMQAVPRGHLDSEPDVQGRLRSMVTAFLRFVRRKRGAYIALVRGASGGDPKVLSVLDEVRSTHVLRWLEAADWPARDPLTQLAVRGWLGSLEEVAVAAADSDVPRESVVELLVQGLLEDLARAGRLGVTEPRADGVVGSTPTAGPGRQAAPERMAGATTPERMAGATAPERMAGATAPEAPASARA